jgi:NitT/TauT family transport system substrate-binding protein
MRYLKSSLLVLMLLLVFLSACGPAQQPTVEPTEAPAQQPTEAPPQEPTEAPTGLVPVKLILNYLAGGPQAGFTYAKELGYYEDVGLDVTIEEGQGSATTAQLVATGNTDFGFADAAAAMAVRAQGGKVKIVAPILQTNGFAIISLKETGIEEPSDMRGKTIAVQPGSAHTALLDAILLANGLSQDDVNLVNIDPAALVGSLLEGAVDAILAGADFQSVQIRDRGFEINEIFYRDAGAPTVGLSILVNDDFMAENPDVVARFVDASLKGWDAARQDPEAAAQSLVDTFVSGDLEQIRKQLDVDLKLVCAPGAETLGAPPQENWQITWDLLTTYQDLPTELPIGDYYTTEFIPADAPICEAEMAAEPTPEYEPFAPKLILNYLAGGPQAGFTYAKELGYYEDVGLDVTIEEGQGSATTAQLVATGNTDFGFADAAAAMAVRAQGGKVKIVAPILQTNGFAIISLKETGIEEPSDMRGKTIAVQPGSAHTALLDAILLANGLSQDDVNLVNIDPAALVGSLLEGAVDAILAGADFQSVQIRDRGFEINEIFYRDAGAPTVGLSILVNDDFMAENPDVVARFVDASLKGWDAARQDPEAAAQSLVDTFVSGDLEQIRKQLDVDLKLVCAPGAETLGAPPQENWQITWDLLTTYQDLPTELPIGDYYTTEFIPADAPACP